MVRCYTYLKAYFLLIRRTAEKEEKLIIKKRRFWVPALFSVAVLLLSSCGSNETNGNGDKRNSTERVADFGGWEIYFCSIR